VGILGREKGPLDIAFAKRWRPQIHSKIHKGRYKKGKKIKKKIGGESYSNPPKPHEALGRSQRRANKERRDME